MHILGCAAQALALHCDDAHVARLAQGDCGCCGQAHRTAGQLLGGRRKPYHILLHSCSAEGHHSTSNVGAPCNTQVDFVSVVSGCLYCRYKVKRSMSGVVRA